MHCFPKAVLAFRSSLLMWATDPDGFLKLPQMVEQQIDSAYTEVVAKRIETSWVWFLRYELRMVPKRRVTISKY